MVPTQSSNVVPDFVKSLEVVVDARLDARVGHDLSRFCATCAEYEDAMAVPDFQSCMLPVLQIPADGGDRTLRETVDGVAAKFFLSDEDRMALIPSGKQTLLGNRSTRPDGVRWDA